MSRREEDLSYSEGYGTERAAQDQVEGEEGDRGLVGDIFRFAKDRYKQSQKPQQQNYGYGQQQQQQQGIGPGGQPYNIGGHGSQPYNAGSQSSQSQYSTGGQGYGAPSSQSTQSFQSTQTSQSWVSIGEIDLERPC